MPASGKMAKQEGIQPNVLWKLLIFALLVAVAPIATYFSTLNYFWKGSTTAAAISAVLAANTVLVGYVIIAFREEAPEPLFIDKKNR